MHDHECTWCGNWFMVDDCDDGVECSRLVSECMNCSAEHGRDAGEP